MITCKESKNLQGHHEALKYIGKHVNHWWDGNGKGILTFAPSNPGVPQLVQVWLPIGDENVCIYDKEGNALPTQVLPREEIELNGLGQPRNPCWPPEIMRNVLFLANSGANRVDSFVCKTSPGKKFNDISADDNYMENEYLRVEVNGAGYILRFYENQGRNAEATFNNIAGLLLNGLGAVLYPVVPVDPVWQLGMPYLLAEKPECIPLGRWNTLKLIITGI